jgi:hypothetical protein
MSLSDMRNTTRRALSVAEEFSSTIGGIRVNRTVVESDEPKERDRLWLALSVLTQENERKLEVLKQEILRLRGIEAEFQKLRSSQTAEKVLAGKQRLLAQDIVRRSGAGIMMPVEIQFE